MWSNWRDGTLGYLHWASPKRSINHRRFATHCVSLRLNIWSAITRDYRISKIQINIFVLFSKYITRAWVYLGVSIFNTFTLADGYSRHVEFLHNAQPQLSSLYWKELSNILWMCLYVFKKYICTIKSIDAYRRHAAFGPYEVWIAHDVYCRQKEMNHELIPI